MQGIGKDGLPLRVMRVHLADEHVQVGGAAGGGDVQRGAVLRLPGKTQSHRVSLPDGNVSQVGRQPARAHILGLHLLRMIIHGAGKIHDDVGAQVGIRFKLLDVIPVRPCIRFPVQTARIVSGHVFAVFRKLHGGAAAGASVAAGYVPRHAVARFQGKVPQAAEQVVIQVFHGAGKGD